MMVQRPEDRSYISIRCAVHRKGRGGGREIHVYERTGVYSSLV